MSQRSVRGRGLSQTQIRRMIYAAMYLALAMVLPFITMNIPEIGKALSPMHIPVMLCGFMCGWPWGMAVGFIAPLLRAVTIGMPQLFPDAVGMAFELAAYGFLTGAAWRVLPHRPPVLYGTLVFAMVIGRLVWGIARAVIMGITGNAFTFGMFIGGALLNAIPGIILHIVLIPLLVMAMERAGLSLNSTTQTE